MHIISRIYPRFLFDKNPDRYMDAQTGLIKKGDLVLAATSGVHEFTVGYVDMVLTESEMVIREIGSKKTCKIHNEQFYKIPIELLSKYEILEGLQYAIYKKVLKAIYKVERLHYRNLLNEGAPKRFHSLDFRDNMCIVKLRRKWEQDTCQSFEFKYSKITTIKELVSLINGQQGGITNWKKN